MEEKGSSDSGSPGMNSETESPPVSGGVVPLATTEREVRDFEAEMGVGFGGGGGTSVGDLMGRKRRGRPRKYDAEGNLRVPPPQGFSLTPSSEFSSKRGRGRGRPPGSGNWQLLASLGEIFANTAAGDFTPHVLTVQAGEDVAANILSVSQKGSRGICVLSANGAVSNVMLRQPGSSGGILTYEGRFEILSLTGSFTSSENGGMRSRTGGLSISLAGPDGRVIGGGVAGLLMAASPIQVVVGSFKPNAYKIHKRRQQYEHEAFPLSRSAPAIITSATPISQASPPPQAAVPPNAQSQFDAQGRLGSGNDADDPKLGPADIAGWGSSEVGFHQRQYPDMNVSAPTDD